MYVCMCTRACLPDIIIIIIIVVVVLVSLIIRGEKMAVNFWPLNYVISFVFLFSVRSECFPVRIGLTLSQIKDRLWDFKFSSPWTWRLLPSLTRGPVRYRCRAPTVSECWTALDLPALAIARPVDILGILEKFPCFTLAILVINWGLLLLPYWISWFLHLRFREQLVLWLRSYFALRSGIWYRLGGSYCLHL
jgi:hypothetical protein